MTIDNTVNKLLTGGSKAARFDNIGDVVEGQIISATTRQETDFATGEPLTFSDGQPRMQLVIELQTDSADGADDDGRRTVYCKWRTTQAIKNALREAGAKTLQEGATLKIKYVGDGEAKKGFAPPKEFKAKYEKPTAVVDIDLSDF